MAGRKQRPAPTDAERLVLFEWQAKHYQSIDSFLPLPSTTNPLFDEWDFESWHSAVLALTVARKFLVGADSSTPARLDLVWRSFLSHCPDAVPDVVEWLTENLSTWPEQLKPAYAIMTATRQAPTGTDMVEELLYGLVLHSDADRAERLIELRRMLGTDIFGHYWGLGSSNPRTLIIGTLQMLEAGRNSGWVNLPEPWAPLWPNTPKPSSTDS